MGSPKFCVRQTSLGLPGLKLAQSVFPAAGPETRLPFVLSKMANERFTHCTYCVAPTAPSVSGGAQHTEKAAWLKPCPKPSKFRPVVGASCWGARRGGVN